MKKTQKILSFIMAIMMVFSIIPITVSAETITGTCGDNLTWTFDDSTGTLTISGTGAMYDYSSNSPWESYKNDIKTVIIENGVTTIGYYAFMNCAILESVKIPDTVTTIGIGSFIYCQSLKNITIPDSVTSISLGAIAYCYSLSDIIVDGNNQNYSSDEYGVLFNKDKTTLIQYPIGNARTDYNIPEGVTTVGDISFAYCQNLASVTIPDGVTKICDGAFAYCNNFTSVTIPDSVTTIGGAAFDYCEDFTDIYYSGSEEDWNKITINSFNEYLFNAEVHYNYHIHDYNSVITETTCTEQGFTTYTCVCGDSYVEDYVDAIGHNDADNDGNCDSCDEHLCDHNCHKSGISGFFWKIINFFNKLFCLNKYCDCGAVHY